jgi:hypothetical protein
MQSKFNKLTPIQLQLAVPHANKIASADYLVEIDMTRILKPHRQPNPHVGSNANRILIHSFCPVLKSCYGSFKQFSRLR